MTHTLMEDAHAVILPAFAGTELSEECKKFLEMGGISILLGESREEYVARRMSDQRRQSETLETFHNVVSEAKRITGDLLVAVDQEIGGICRLHDLVPPFPSVSNITLNDAREIEEVSLQIGYAAAELGVNCFLSPVLDVLTGENPWLKGRTYSFDPETIGRVSAAYIRGVQRAGIAATAKHFPGFHNIALDPATKADAEVTEPMGSFGPGFIPFREAIAAHVELVMVGPAIVHAFDPERAALRSKKVIDVLKNDFAFEGVVLADDLDSKATMRDDPLEQVAIDAVNAGCDFLLLADIDTQLSDVAGALVTAANTGKISRADLSNSASKMRSLALRYEKTI